MPLVYPGFTYRRRPGSLSTTSSVEFYRGCVRNARLAASHWCATGEAITDERAQVLAAIHANALEAFSGRDAAAFDASLRDLLALAPGHEPKPSRLRALARVVGARNAYRLRAAWHGFSREGAAS